MPFEADYLSTTALCAAVPLLLQGEDRHALSVWHESCDAPRMVTNGSPSLRRRHATLLALAALTLLLPPPFGLSADGLRAAFDASGGPGASVRERTHLFEIGQVLSVRVAWR